MRVWVCGNANMMVWVWDCTHQSKDFGLMLTSGFASSGTASSVAMSTSS